MKLLVAAVAAVVCHWTFAAEIFPSGQPRAFTTGEVLEQGATVGGYPFWIGEKKWMLFDLIRSDSAGTAASIPIGEARAFQIEGEKLVSVISVGGNLATGRAQDWIDEPCKREDMIFKENLTGSFRNVNCVTINHLTGYLRAPSGSFAKLYLALRERQIDTPPTVLRITFTRYADNMRRFTTFIDVNPEIVGFARENEPNWVRNPWHKSASLKDSEKKKFIDALSAWSLNFAKQMDIGFANGSGNKDALAQIASWRAGMPVEKK